MCAYEVLTMCMALLTYDVHILVGKTQPSHHWTVQHNVVNKGTQEIRNNKVPRNLVLIIPFGKSLIFLSID